MIYEIIKIVSTYYEAARKSILDMIKIGDSATINADSSRPPSSDPAKQDRTPIRLRL
jgi:hypothetical protein